MGKPEPHELGFCGHYAHTRVLLAADAFGGVVWCNMCGAASDDGGKTWTLPRMEAARREPSNGKPGKALRGPWF